MLGPDGVEAMKDALVELEGTINGLRDVVIGLIIAVVVAIALALHAWQKANPAEEEEER